MELIEPTVKRAFDDHENMQTLNYNYDKLKNKVEELDMKCTHEFMRLITAEEVSKRFQDLVFYLLSHIPLGEIKE